MSQSLACLLPRSLPETPFKKIHYSFNFLRRRVIWLLGVFLSQSLSAAAQSRIYETLLSILNDSIPSDLGAKLTAARSLGASDSWEFDRDRFAPYLQESLKLVCQLMHSVETTEGKIRLVNVIADLIEKMDSRVRILPNISTDFVKYCVTQSGKFVFKQIAPFVDSLMGMIPMLWAAAGDQAMLKTSVLVMLTRLADVRVFLSLRQIR